MNIEQFLIDDDEGIKQCLASSKTIAVIGIKPESRSNQPAFYVPKFMQNAGYKILPVPVYYPEVTEILGEKIYRHLSEIEQEIDIVNLFRKPLDVPKHIDEIISAKPKYVWMQLGIRNDDAALKFAEAGIKVIQDRCLLVEYRAFFPEASVLR
jgi:predicted CoA-binding protein